MISLNIVKLDNIEKAMSARWAFSLLTAITFTDCFLIIRHNTNISSIDLDWLKLNATPSEVIVIIALFSTCFGLIIPGVFFVVNFILERIKNHINQKRIQKNNEKASRKYDIDDSNFIHKDILKSLAISTANTSAYKAYEEAVSLQNNKKFIKYLCQCLVFLTGVGYAFSGDKNPVLEDIIFTKITSLPWYQDYPVRFIYVIFIFYIIAFAISQKDHDADYIYIKEHNLPT